MIDEKSFKQFENFQRYAQMICEKFDVTIQMEASRAETDGRVIYLPNILSMTDKELDLMYGVLLHECGHIRYSTFSEDYFSKLKTQSHAFLANNIEDARIENLLLNDFGGASTIFSDLYCVHTQDADLMKKVFKFSGKTPSLFEAVCFHVHNQLSKFQTPDLKTLTRQHRRVALFWAGENIDDLLLSSPLKNDQDVLALTNELYERFHRFFKVKDDSAQLNYAAEQKKKAKLEEMLSKMKEQAQKVESEMLDLSQEIRQINDDLANFEQAHQAQYDTLRQNLAQEEIQYKKLRDQFDWKSSLDQARKEQIEAQESFKQGQSSLVQKTEEKRVLEEQLRQGKNGRGKDLTEEQKNALKERIEGKTRLEEKAKTKMSNALEKEKMAKQHEQDVLAQQQQDPSLYNEFMDKEALGNRMGEASIKIEELTKELAKLESGKKGLQSQKSALEEKMRSAQENLMEKTAESLFDLEGLVKSGQFDVDVLPELNYQDAWPEAGQVQVGFDQKATKETGKVVRNGQRAAGMFGSNVRDILTYIDKKEHQVKDIDVATLFKEKIHQSKFEDLNAEVRQVAREDKSVVGVYGTHREHIPLTTHFDVVKKAVSSKETAAYQNLLMKNAVFYKDLARVFAKHFKFSKKDTWKGAQEEGSFDTRNLWKLPTNQGDDFYEIARPKYVNQTAAVILVDMSGSQNKEATDYGEKVRALAIGLSKALESVHVKHEVLGYHAPVCEEMRQMPTSTIYTRRSNRLETLVVKESGQKDQLGLMNLEPQLSDNSDGESLRIALKRVKMMRAKSHMIFVISDGKPFLCDTDMSVLDQDLREALKKSAREKVKVYGLGFFDQLGAFFDERFCNASEEKDVLSFFEKLN